MSGRALGALLLTLILTPLSGLCLECARGRCSLPAPSPQEEPSHEQHAARHEAAAEMPACHSVTATREDHAVAPVSASKLTADSECCGLTLESTAQAPGVLAKALDTPPVFVTKPGAGRTRLTDNSGPGEPFARLPSKPPHPPLYTLNSVLLI